MSRRLLSPVDVSRRVKPLALCLLALAACVAPARAQSSQDPVYVFHTSIGDMRVQLFPDIAPQTVANFLRYVNSGAYNSSFIHRATTTSADGIAVLQGGGYTVDASANVTAIPTNAPVVNEFHLSNTRGTIAMAKTSDPNSATDQWFFNEVDNSASLDNPNNSGGFTVFGKILDTTSLSVMDSIGSVPTYNEGSPFNQIPLINYQSGPVTQANFVRVTSITPGWTAMSLSAGADGYTRALWDNAAGTADVWLMDPSGSFVGAQRYGPFPGWTARQITTGLDNNTRLLWTSTEGTADLWLLDPYNRLVTHQAYGPYSGWTLDTISAAPDGGLRALWTNVNGTAALWRLDAQNRALDQQQYGPFQGWTARTLRTGPDGIERLLWTNVNGTAAFWRLDAQNRLLDQQQYGPIAGWTATDLVGAPNGAHAVWTRSDGLVALWDLDASDRVQSQQQYGPFAGWSLQSLSVGPAGYCRLLWDNVGGTAAFWRTDSSGVPLDQRQFGPF